ncbi:MAG: methionine--tRNA ligase [bacterium]|nr:methionine--tRNA ligase [bacterium]
MRFYITTPIYYPNSEPHIGTAYTTIACDVISRFYKQKNYDVFFLTGTDENSNKIIESANKVNKKPIEYVNEMAELFKNIWKNLDIEYTKFIRTTEDYHIKTAQFVFQKLYEQGYIYKGLYEGWYCIHCETFWTTSKVDDSKLCPNIECRRPLNYIKEENYFFKLSAFEDKLLKYYEDNPDFVYPDYRFNEVVSFVKSGLQDLSVSRKYNNWGIRVPFDQDYSIYVWIDALTNYISALGYPFELDLFDKYWEVSHHMVGKDIIRFHAVIWPAILMALNIKLPKKIIAHGWLMYDNQKISKSKGGDIFNLKEIALSNDKIKISALRYYLLREGSFGQDIPVSLERFKYIYTSELSNNIGNLFSRVLAIIERKLNKYVFKESDFSYIQNSFINERLSNFDKELSNFNYSKAVLEILNLADYLNKIIENYKVWEIKDKNLNQIMYELVYSLVVLNKMLYPFMPFIANNILEQLNLPLESLKWDYTIPDSFNIKERKILFPKIENVLA